MRPAGSPAHSGPEPLPTSPAAASASVPLPSGSGSRAGRGGRGHRRGAASLSPALWGPAVELKDNLKWGGGVDSLEGRWAPQRDLGQPEGWAGTNCVKFNKVFCISLPGRSSHLEEPFAKHMTSIVHEITSVLLKEVKEKPFAFFAHSLGTYMSLAIGLHLKKKYGLEPAHLFMSAAHAPNSAVHLGLKSMALPDENNEFLACMEMLPHNEDVRENMVVTSREDTRVIQIFLFEEAEINIPFSCDVTYFDDKIYDVKGWQELTNEDTSFYELPGDYLYLLKPSSESLLTKHITRCIENAGL